MKKNLLVYSVLAFTIPVLAPLAPDLRAAEITAVQSGPWSDLATWGGTVPTPGDTAINSGLSIDVDGNYAVAGLQLIGGGTFNGTGNLTASGNLVWSGSTFSNAGLTIGVGATATLGSTISGGYEFLYVNSGTIAADNFGNVTVLAPAAQQWGLHDNGTGNTTWNNKSGGTFTLTGCASILGGNLSIFNNEAGAMLAHTGNTVGNDSAVVQWGVSNNGSVNVQEGTLTMDSNTLSGNGTYDVSAGANLNFFNNVLNGNATITGAGAFRPQGDIGGTGTLNLNGNTTWVNSTLHNTGGIVIGANGTATLGDAIVAGYETIYAFPGTITADNFGNVTLLTPANQQYGLYDSSAGNTRWNNKSGSTFTLTGCASIIGSNASILTNEAGATFNKTGSDASYVAWSVVNNSTVSVQAGSLEMRQNTLTGNGSYDISSGASLIFNGNDIAENTTVTGAGAFVPSGTLVGIGTLHLNGNTTWLGGQTLNNPGGVVFGANATATLGSTLSGGYEILYVNSSTITADNFGNVTVLSPPSAQWGLYDNATGNTLWNNKSGSTFNLTGCASIIGSVTSVYHNEAGAMFVHSGSGTGDDSSYVAWSFDNDGTVNVTNGTLTMQSNILSGNGTYTVANGASLVFSGTDIAENTTVTGAGTFVPSGTLVGNGTLHLNGNTTWAGSQTFSNPGGVVFGANATATLGSTISGGYELLHVGSGTIAVDNFGSVSVLSPPSAQWGLYDAATGTALWNNKSGGTFTLTGCASIIGSATSVFTNEAGAMFVHTGNGANDESSYVAWSFVNNGTIAVQSGMLQFTSGTFGGTNGTVTVAPNATLQFSNESVAPNTTVGGSGTVSLVNTVSLQGAAQMSNVFNQGTVDGAGTLTVTDSLLWHNGAFTQAGGLIIGANATATLGSTTGGGYELAYNGTAFVVDNFGNATVLAPPSAQWGLYDSGVGTTTWNNKSGSGFTLTGCASIIGSPTSAFFNEAGAMFAHTGNDAGDDSSYVDWTLDNQGAVSVHSGTLDLRGPVVQNDAGNSTLTGGAWSVHANSTLTFPGSPNFTTLAQNASVTLDGAGSTFAAVEGVTAIFGSLQITGGRQFSKAVNFGVFNGTLYVSGNGSLFATTGQVSVFGGQVSVNDGASMSLDALDLGNGGASVMSVGLGTDPSTLTVANVLVGSGVGGSATLNIHEGGLANITGNLFLSVSAGVPSTVNLNTGGVLQVGGANGITQTHGNYAFNWNGGMIKVAGGNLTSSIHFTLGGDGELEADGGDFGALDVPVISFFDTNGLQATLSGNLSGTGSLAKTGLGTLTLTGNNTYQGTYVYAGTLAIDGATATLSHSGPLGVINVGVADGGDAAFLVQNGAQVVAYGSTLGVVANSTGSAVVTGANSSLSTSNTLIVGDAGVGSLTVSNGSTMVASNTILGNQTTGNGTVLVTGANSTLNTTSGLTVGLAGLGNFTVNNGAHATANETLLANEVGSTGTVNVDGMGSVFTTTTLLNIGYNGTGNFTVSGGGNATAANALLGYSATSMGALTVTGANSTFVASASLGVGESGTGTVLIGNGGHLGAFDAVLGGAGNSTGTVTVSGANSTLTLSSLLYIGNNGTGSLTVNGGGLATAGTSVLGYFASGNGTLSVAGANSTFTAGSDLFVGLGGQGALTVSNGGAISADFVGLGIDAGSNGTALVTGASSTLTTTGNLTIASAGTGSLTVSNSGLVTTGGNIYIGLAGGGNGTFNVNASAVFNDGALIVGQAGAGLVAISGGGNFTSNGGTLGANSSAHGTVTVAGNGSIWNMPASMEILTVAKSGSGSVTVSNGATLVNLNGLVVGQNAGSNGTITITGTASDWNVGDATIGNDGQGNVTIADGAHAAMGETYFGRNSGSAGSLTVTGAGSQLTTGTSQFWIGGDGNGTATVSLGGNITNYLTLIGANATGAGTVLITGPGSVWNSWGGFSVGHGGVGCVTVSSGASFVGDGSGVGSDTNGNGTVTVTGAGSMWMSNILLVVGESGLANFTVTNGGALVTDRLELGWNFGSNGTVNLIGVNSTASTGPSSMLVGLSGRGQVFVSNGATLTSSSVIVGRDLTGNGSVTVTGAGSQWMTGTSSSMIFGRSGLANVTVTAGGAIVSGGILLGENAPGNGTLHINGANSTVSSNGTIVVGQSGTGALNIGTGGALISNGGTVGANGGSSGSVFITGGSWNAGAANLSIGDLGVGIATIAGQLTGNLVKIGVGSTGNGAVLVEGAGALFQANNTLYIGESGLGNLTAIASANITNGGNAWIGFNANSTGTVTIANATWTSNGSIIVGDAGHGTLTIDDGGVVSVTNSNPLLLATFGTANATVDLKTGGLLKVRGTDGILAGSGNYSFNWNGGTIQANGANFTTAINATLIAPEFAVTDLDSGSASIFDTNGLDATWSGVLSGNGSLAKAGLGTLTLTANNTYTGDTTVLAGTLAVSGSSARINTPAANLTVGTTGAANLTVSGGGNVTANFVTFGASPTGNATVTVTGAGSRLNTLNMMQVGDGGVGNLSVLSGGNVAFLGTEALEMRVAANAGSSGSVLVSGSGSRIFFPTGFANFTSIYVGKGGNGTLTVTNGGLISALNTDVFVGDDAGATGALLVTGANTTANVLSVVVGFNGGSGNVTIAQGASLGVLGGLNVTNGTFLATGAGTQIGHVPVQVGVGAGRTGVLTFSDGAKGGSPSTTIVGASGSTGMLTVTGAGSRFDATQLQLGPTGNGTMTIADGGLVTADTLFRLANAANGTATLNLNTGGILRLGMNVFQAGAGNYTFNWAGGSIENLFEANMTIPVNATLLPSVTASTINTGNFTATWSGMISGSDSFAKSGNGTLILTGNNAISGLITIVAGTLQVGDGGTSGALGTAFIHNHSSLVFNRDGTLTVSGNISEGGTLSKLGSGTVNIAGLNTYTGATMVSAGTLAAVNGLNGTSSITVAGGAHLSLGGNSSTGTLTLNGNMTLNSSVTVGTAYNNANFGTGNAFDAHANVAGNGTINAAGDVAQNVAGANVTGGNTTTPVLTLPNLHEGGTVTASYAIANNGTTGPQLQGAIQNTLITDARLSGAGVTAQNWGPLGPGNTTTALNVTVSGTSVGPLAANQSVAIVNNFDNVADQILNIQGGSVYRYAVASNLTQSINLGDLHEDDATALALTVTNSAAASGGYTEGLSATFGNSTGAAFGSGGFADIGPGNSSSALMIGLNTSAPGPQSGHATYDFLSNAVSGSGLSDTLLSPQTVTVSGTVYRLASANPQTPTVELGIVHVGDLVENIFTITNSAAASGGFTETLGAGFGNVAGSFTTNGSVTGLGAGNTSNAMSVLLNTSAAGFVTSANVGLNFVSQALGGTTLGNTSLPSQTVTFNATINNYADPTYSLLSGPANITFVQPELIVLTFDPVDVYLGIPAVANLTLANAAAAPADWLNGNFTITNTSGQFLISGFNNFTDLQSGQFLTLTVTFLATTQGNYSASVDLAALSLNSGGFSDNLGNFELQITGAAVPEPSTYAALAGLLALAAAALRRRSRRGRS